jgi:outer membrane lipoprotein-sorting protein
MRKTIWLLFCITVMMSITACVNAGVREQAREASANFKDITLTCKVAYSNLRELKKISKDFSNNYDLKSTTVRYKYRDKMRVDGKLGIMNVRMIINGDIKAFIVPPYKQKENIKDKPHKRQTELDLGVFTDSLWSDYIVTSVGADDGMYKIVFVRSNARSKNLACWVDCRTLKLLKMERYESDGSMKAKYVYSNHKEYHGIWVPQRIDVYNEDNKLSATTVYEKISVNSGIPDSEFEIH